MRLYCVRHARAEQLAPCGDDARRELTHGGAAAFEREVAALKRMDTSFDVIRHSPLVRAIQTAELLTPLLDGETIVTPELARSPNDELLRALRRDPARRMALVGHEPWLSQLVFWLVSGWQLRDPSDHPSPFLLEKGGVAILEGEPRPGGMTLVALWPPKALRAARDRR